MKNKLLSIFLISLVLMMLLAGSSCAPEAAVEPGASDSTPQATDPSDTDGAEIEKETEGRQPVFNGEKIEAEQWLAYEISFKSDKTYADPVYTVTTDVIFTNEETNKKLVIPAFWDGGVTWKVRFALPDIGEWTYVTECSDKENGGLHLNAGEVSCVAYTGDLDIYKHGFVKTEPGVRYFMYDDGTPFFYLADTHFTLPIEEINGIGEIPEELAAEHGITSQFEHIMDYRVEQGYTVIQSQPLGRYVGKTGNSWFGDENGTIYDYGVNDAMLAKFQELDKRFAYIAQKGLVHANTQLSYPEELIEAFNEGAITHRQLDMLCRYWVARYCAYPVLWSTVQEGDNDFYGWEGCTTENNPWLKVMRSISKHDPYDHPTTCHQENTDNVRVENSTFGRESSHDWYASQWSSLASNGTQLNWNMLKEYWNNPGSKPVVNYEGRYDHFWAGTRTTRTQAWVTYFNGQVGFGYGAQPIFNMFWAEREEQTPTTYDGEEYDRGLNWLEGLHLEAGEQVTYVKKFLSEFEWWKLVPCFNGSEYYEPSGKNYSVTTIDNKLYAAYFYGSGANDSALGSFTSMENADYEIRWMNCRTGEWLDAETVSITDGTYKIPQKPDSGDWALYAKLIEE